MYIEEDSAHTICVPANCSLPLPQVKNRLLIPSEGLDTERKLPLLWEATSDEAIETLSQTDTIKTMRTRTVIPFFILTLLLFSCNGAKKTAQKEGKDPLIEQGTSANAQPPLIVYKTRADYTKNVPVLLSCDKTHIVSFPHPKDLKQGGKFRYPKR
ncbi:MAG: hypothetical protein CSA04_01840, partial [Bacteroidetes bacterium]